MKKIDLFCASPAATAICSGTDERSMVRRHVPRSPHSGPHPLHDQQQRRRIRTTIPCSSQLPISPKKVPISSAKLYQQKTSKNASYKENIISDMRRKSLSDIIDVCTSPRGSFRSQYRTGSSRYRLVSDDTSLFDQVLLPDCDRASALVPVRIKSSDDSPRLKVRDVCINSPQVVARTPRLKFSPSDDFSPRLQSSLSTRSRDQVVVLRVSLHCKGCEGKVRKHISRMEGVRSFSIDFTEKKVTIIGDVSPFDVLASVSKVKNAELWTSPSSSSSSSPSMTCARLSVVI